MVDLNKAFAGEDPGFMDRLFPDEDWMEHIRCPDPTVGWSWFWDAFAPYGMFMSEDPAGCGLKSLRDMAPGLLAAVAKGFLTDVEPAAVFVESGRTMHYWPLLKDGLTDDLMEYSSAAAPGKLVADG